VLLIVIVAMFLLLVLFISPIAKWAIEKYGVEYTGRQVNMDKLHINLLTGNIESEGLKIYEAKSKKIFFECHALSATMQTHKLLLSEYDLTEIKLSQPVLNIIETGNRFNFSDLIDRFTKKSPSEKETNKQIKWWIEKAQVDGATIVYTNTSPYNSIKIDRCNINIPGISWNNKIYSVLTDFSFASGGDVKGKISFDKNSWIYSLALDINRFDITPFYTYLKDYLKVNSLNGFLSTHLNLTGNMHAASDIAASGNITADNFSIIDNVNDTLTAISKMEINIDSLNTSKNIYKFANISLQQPYLKVEMYADGYNFDRLATSPAIDSASATTTYANVFVMLSDYIQNIVKNYVVSNYNADKFLVENGKLDFYDYTLNDKFYYSLDSLHLFSDKINSNDSMISLTASSLLNRTGQINANLNISPKDFKDFNIACAIKNVTVADFNPYSKYYVATPFLDGVATYTEKTTVVNRKLKSDNLILINHIIAGKKDRTIKPQYNMPVRLGVALLRDVHGNIKLNIPVAGSLDDPKFKFGKIIWQILGNLLVKAATAPFHLLAGLFGGKEDDYKAVNFAYLQTTIDTSQQKQLDQLAKIVKERPDLKIEFIQVCNKEDEAEALAIFEEKKKYLGLNDSITYAQMQQINSLKNSDSSFIKYLDNNLKSNSAFLSTQEKCMLLTGKENMSRSIDSIMQKRNETISQYLQQRQTPVANLSIHNASDPNDPNLGNYPKLIINIAAAEVADSTTIKK
jgi:predicted nucleic acid-binding protein